jgi:spore germination cell wall hydrolase CwlJ-like protein
MTIASSLTILIGILTGFSAEHAADPQVVQDLHALAQNVFHEARGESIEGRRAVAWTTLNRTRDGRWPKTIAGVVWQHKQFSWTRFKSRRHLTLRTDLEVEAWRQAVIAAYEVYFRKVDDPTKGATHFFAHRVVTPQWSRSFKHRVRIGGHTFLRK